MVSVKQLEKKLNGLKNKKVLLVEKKEKCVNEQNKYENDYLDEQLVDNRKYRKLIELDFELAAKIEEKEKEIKNLQARLRRRKKKDLEAQTKAELKEQGIILHNKQSTIYSFV
jgi:hypothetical protein